VFAIQSNTISQYLLVGNSGQEIGKCAVLVVLVAAEDLCAFPSRTTPQSDGAVVDRKKIVQKKEEILINYKRVMQV
jgi:hypothetical protein